MHFFFINFSSRKLFLITVAIAHCVVPNFILSQQEIYFLLLLWNLQKVITEDSWIIFAYLYSIGTIYV